VSPSLWKSEGKVSLKRDKSVSQIVEKYRSQYPFMERDLLRHLIRVEGDQVSMWTDNNHVAIEKKE
jgi:hypothetical protein